MRDGARLCASVCSLSFSSPVSLLYQRTSKRVKHHNARREKERDTHRAREGERKNVHVHTFALRHQTVAERSMSKREKLASTNVNNCVPDSYAHAYVRVYVCLTMPLSSLTIY